MNTAPDRRFHTLFPALHFLLATALALTVAAQTRENPTIVETLFVAMAVGGAVFGAAAFYNWWRGRGTAGLFVVGAGFHLGAALLTGWLTQLVQNSVLSMAMVLFIQGAIALALMRSAGPARLLSPVWQAMANVLCGAWLVIMLGGLIVAL